MELVTDKIAVAELVYKAIDGDHWAKKELYTRYSGPLFNISMRMTANREDAEDIIQESFINAFNNLDKLRDPQIFGGWLRQIVINNCLIHAKRKRVFDVLPDTFAATTEIEEDVSWLPDKSLDKIHEAIKKLPEGCRQIFLLYAMEDFKHKEIAVKLNISESTSKSQYLRAKKLLLDYLKKDLWMS